MPSAVFTIYGFLCNLLFVCIVLFRVPIKNMGSLLRGCHAIFLVSLWRLRVYLLYHTAAQVAVGVTVGASFGFGVFHNSPGSLQGMGIVDWVILWPLSKISTSKIPTTIVMKHFESEFLSYKARIEKKKRKKLNRKGYTSRHISVSIETSINNITRWHTPWLKSSQASSSSSSLRQLAELFGFLCLRIQA